MNIILLSRKHGRPRTVQLQPRLLMIIAAVVVVLCVALGCAGYYAAARLFPSQTGQSDVVSADSRDQLKAMTSRLVEMQARLVRLDALGEHLAESANLNTEEFDFKKKPPMGGPLTEELTVLGDRPSVMLRLQELSAEIEQKEAQLMALDGLMSGKRIEPKSYLANMPVRSGYVTSRYGYRSDPFTGRTTFHGGIDFAGPEGTHVFSVAPGIVTYAGAKTGYGNVVEVSHGDGMSTRYAHASRVAVKVGDLVAKDQLVAYMGSTGRSTGPHLHYEVLRSGTQVDPATYIAHASR
ncbi:MAG: M23 family metallopeptidase [Pedobacter sp.]|nr:M23 family metallopeptidase [Pedobacter sp.]